MCAIRKTVEHDLGYGDGEAIALVLAAGGLFAGDGYYSQQQLGGAVVAEPGSIAHELDRSAPAIEDSVQAGGLPTPAR